MPLREAKRVLFSADLAGYSRAIASADAMSVAQFLNDWYRSCAHELRARGGRVVKFIGDGCLAVFDEERAVEAVECGSALKKSLDTICATHGFPVRLSVRVHTAIVAEGDFGPDDDLRYDIIGSGVNHLFLMGGGPGIKISEPVFRQLPNALRGEWEKHKAPATYSKDG
jgi:adenylate cyclase